MQEADRDRPAVERSEPEPSRLEAAGIDSGSKHSPAGGFMRLTHIEGEVAATAWAPVGGPGKSEVKRVGPGLPRTSA